MPNIELRCVKGALSGQSFVFEVARVTLGRRDSCDIEFPDADKVVSGLHCELVVEDGQWLLRDLGSTNGTLIDGVTIGSPRRVEQGMSFDVGYGGPTLEVVAFEVAAASSTDVVAVDHSALTAEALEVPDITVPDAFQGAGDVLDAPTPALWVDEASPIVPTDDVQAVAPAAPESEALPDGMPSDEDTLDEPGMELDEDDERTIAMPSMADEDESSAQDTDDSALSLGLSATVSDEAEPDDERTIAMPAMFDDEPAVTATDSDSDVTEPDDERTVAMPAMFDDEPAVTAPDSDSDVTEPDDERTVAMPAMFDEPEETGSAPVQEEKVAPVPDAVPEPAPAVVTDLNSPSTGRTQFYMGLMDDRVKQSSKKLKVMIAVLAAALIAVIVFAVIGEFDRQELREQLTDEVQALKDAKTNLANTSNKLADLKIRMESAQGDAKKRLMEQAKLLEETRANYEKKLTEQQASLAKLKASDDAAETIARKHQSALFMLIMPTKNGQQAGFCTAFAIDTNGILGTNSHCLRGIREAKKNGHQVIARMNKNPSKSYPVVAFKEHPTYDSKKLFTHDVAVLKLNLEGDVLPVAATLASNDKVRAKLGSGQAIFTMGYPGKVMNEEHPAADFRAAVISRITDFDNNSGTPLSSRIIWHSALTSKGTSGSPIFDEEGEVIAVNTGGLGVRSVSTTDAAGKVEKQLVYSATGLNFGIRVDSLASLLPFGAGTSAIAGVKAPQSPPVPTAKPKAPVQPKVATPPAAPVEGYSELVKKTFQAGCVKKSTPEMCSCMYMKISQQVPYPTFKAESVNMASGKGISDALKKVFGEIALECAKELKAKGINPMPKKTEAPEGYNEAVRKAFHGGCVKKSTPEMCHCMYGKITQQVPYATFKIESQKMASGKQASDALKKVFNAIAVACMNELNADPPAPGRR